MSRPVTASEPLTPIAAASGGFEQITISSSSTTLAAGLTAGIPSEARHAIFYPETADVRWRADGTAPTDAVGIVMEKDAMHVFEDQRGIFDNMKLISASSSSTLNVHFFK
jgi:hypothetical protein